MARLNTLPTDADLSTLRACAESMSKGISLANTAEVKAAAMRVALGVRAADIAQAQVIDGRIQAGLFVASELETLATMGSVYGLDAVVGARR